MYLPFLSGIQRINKSFKRFSKFITCQFYFEAQAVWVIFSIVETAKATNLAPRDYIQFLFENLSDMKIQTQGSILTSCSLGESSFWKTLHDKMRHPILSRVPLVFLGTCFHWAATNMLFDCCTDLLSVDGITYVGKRHEKHLKLNTL